MTKTKNIISITDTAADKIRSIIVGKDKKPIGIRISVKNSGCSGLSYQFEYCYEENAADDKIQKDGFILFIDPKATLFIIGTVLDYVDKKVEKGFVFINPNEKAKCGCGKSFSV